jgi:hypothetical protein
LKVAMNTAKHLQTFFDERKESLLDELRVVEMALKSAQPCDETIEWIERLKRWRLDLKSVIEAMPDLERERDPEGADQRARRPGSRSRTG